jgi:hypothetical protein
MRYRFVFVSSQFHRGRVRLAYDSTQCPIGSALVEGLTFTKVIDLAETTDVTIDIPFFAPTSMLDLSAFYTSGEGTVIGTTSAPTLAYSTTYLNGGWSLTVLNPLIGPVGATSIDVHCFASCPDLVLADPLEPLTDTASYFNHYETQSLVAPLPEKKEQTTMIPAPKRTVDFSEYVGESILSLRTLLHRTVNYCPINFPAPASVTPGGMFDFDFVLQWPRRPLTFGPVRPYQTTNSTGEAITLGNGLGYLHKTKTLADPAKAYFYNYVRTSPLSWMTPCYIGHRGSYNYKFVLQNPFDQYIGVANSNTPCVKMITVSRSHQVDRSATGQTSLATADTFSSATAARDIKISRGTHVGSAVGTMLAGASLEVELPFVSKYKFGTTSVSPTLCVNDLEESGDTMEIQVRAYQASSKTYDLGLRSYVSAGADFNLFGYLYPPTVFYITGESTIPGGSTSY